MKNYVYREITEEAEVVNDDGDTLKVRALRTRNSNGAQGIVVLFGKQRIDFNIRDECEEHARLVISLLQKVCNDKCELPGNSLPISIQEALNSGDGSYKP
jgi:hypothetical protein